MHRLLVTCGIVFVGVMLAPVAAQAQSASRATAEARSTNRETHIQHDSLAVHFLRSPKAKPAGAASAAARKSAAHVRRDSAPATTVNTTPLPAKARQSKP
jgi:hypothetical protein